MSGGVAVIKVGAPAESEMKAKKEALDDAISATKAAVAEGIVPGGGLALLRCTEAVAREEAQAEGDERTGIQVLKRALEAPARQIAENSAVDGGVVVARMLDGKGNYGFDAARKQYVDLVEAGHRRSDQGRAHRAGERRLGRERAAPERSDHDGGGGARQGPGRARTRAGAALRDQIVHFGLTRGG